MLDFFIFWKDCFERAHSWGDGVLSIAEGVGIFFWWFYRKSRKLEKAREATLKTVAKWTFLIVLFFGTFVISPFVQYKVVKDENSNLKEPLQQLKTDALILSVQLFNFSTNWIDENNLNKNYALKEKFFERFRDTHWISNVQRRLDEAGQQSDELDALVSGFIHSDAVDSNAVAQTSAEIKKLANNLK
jgi:hypothetical protein